MQNAVRGKDFFSLDEFHKRLQEKFWRLGYYYEIQRGSFTALKPSERAYYKGRVEYEYLVGDKFKNLIPALEATQAFAAGFKDKPAVALAGSDKLTPTGGDAYDAIFNDELKPTAKRFLFPYLVRLWAQSNGYGRAAKNAWRAHSVLFFVNTYFVIVTEIFKHQRILDTLEISIDEVPLEIWERIFREPELNLELLKLTDDILDRYFGDSKIADEAVGQEIRTFLRSQEKINKYKGILMRYINNIVLDSPKYSELLDTVKRVVVSK